MSEAGATAFEGSLDGSLARSFDDMEFIVSLHIIRGKRKSELAEFLPKRGEDSSTRQVLRKTTRNALKGKKASVRKAAATRGKALKGIRTAIRPRKVKSMLALFES